MDVPLGLHMTTLDDVQGQWEAGIGVEKARKQNFGYRMVGLLSMADNERVAEAWSFLELMASAVSGR